MAKITLRQGDVTAKLSEAYYEPAEGFQEEGTWHVSEEAIMASNLGLEFWTQTVVLFAFLGIADLGMGLLRGLLKPKTDVHRTVRAKEPAQSAGPGG